MLCPTITCNVARSYNGIVKTESLLLLHCSIILSIVDKTMDRFGNAIIFRLKVQLEKAALNVNRVTLEIRRGIVFGVEKR